MTQPAQTPPPPQPPLPVEHLAGIIAITGDLLRQATEFRAFAFPPADAAPPVLHEAIVRIRTRLDVLEVFQAQAIDLRDSSAMAAARLEEVAQDAWDDLADSARRQGLRDQYEGAQERYATWRLRTRGQRRAAREAKEAAAIAASCEAKIRLMYRGLDGARLDLHARLRAQAWENSLERT